MGLDYNLCFINLGAWLKYFNKLFCVWAAKLLHTFQHYLNKYRVRHWNITLNALDCLEKKPLNRNNWVVWLATFSIVSADSIPNISVTVVCDSYPLIFTKISSTSLNNTGMNASFRVNNLWLQKPVFSIFLGIRHFQVCHKGTNPSKYIMQ